MMKCEQEKGAGLPIKASISGEGLRPLGRQNLYQQSCKAYLHPQGDFLSPLQNLSIIF